MKQVLLAALLLVQAIGVSIAFPPAAVDR